MYLRLSAGVYGFKEPREAMNRKASKHANKQSAFKRATICEEIEEAEGYVECM